LETGQCLTWEKKKKEAKSLKEHQKQRDTGTIPRSKGSGGQGGWGRGPRNSKKVGVDCLFVGKTLEREVAATERVVKNLNEKFDKTQPKIGARGEEGT